MSFIRRILFRLLQWLSPKEIVTVKESLPEPEETRVERPIILPSKVGGFSKKETKPYLGNARPRKVGLEDLWRDN